MKTSPLPPDDSSASLSRSVPSSNSILPFPVINSPRKPKVKYLSVLPDARQSCEPMQDGESDLPESTRELVLDRVHVLEGPDPFCKVVRAQQEWMLDKMTDSHRDPGVSTTSLPVQPGRAQVMSTANDVESITVSEQRVQQPTRDYDALLDAVAQLQRRMDAIQEQDGARDENPPAYDENAGGGGRS
jgi:hypothetical protein